MEKIYIQGPTLWEGISWSVKGQTSPEIKAEGEGEGSTARRLAGHLLFPTSYKQSHKLVPGWHSGLMSLDDPQRPRNGGAESCPEVGRAGMEVAKGVCPPFVVGNV